MIIPYGNNHADGLFIYGDGICYRCVVFVLSVAWRGYGAFNQAEGGMRSYREEIKF